MTKLSKQHLKRVLKARGDRIMYTLGMASAAIYCTTFWVDDDWRVVATAVAGYACAMLAIRQLVKTAPPLPPLPQEEKTAEEPEETTPEEEA